jgi:PleD family two-component response regulator
MNAADNALYEAKRAGKNRVIARATMTTATHDK